jgi:hypothetical protein
LTPTGQVDPGSIQTRATQAIANQAIPSQSKVLKQAKTQAAGMQTMPDDTMSQGQSTAQGAQANAIVADFEAKMTAMQQQGVNWGMATQSKAEATQSYLTDLQTAKTKAEKAMSDAVSTWTKGSQLADKYIADASADMARITGQIKELTEQYSVEPQTALVGSIVSGVQGFLQANKANERGIAERYGINSPEMENWTAAKRVSIGAMVGDLTSKAWDRVQQIRNTGLSAFATAGVALATNVNWVRQKALDFEQAKASSADAYQLSMGAYVAGLDAAKNTTLGAWADWLDQSPVAMVETTPMMQQLLELQTAYDARVKTETAQFNKRYQVAPPIGTTY